MCRRHSDPAKSPFIVRAQPKADTFQSHDRKAEPWGLRFLIESLLWERDRALPNVLERNLLILPARLEIPVGKIRTRSPIPFEPLAKIVVGFCCLRCHRKIRCVSIIEFVVDDGGENLHCQQRIVYPDNKRLLVSIRRAVDIIVRRQLAPETKQCMFAGCKNDPADASGEQFRNGDNLSAGILSHRE